MTNSPKGDITNNQLRHILRLCPAPHIPPFCDAGWRRRLADFRRIQPRLEELFLARVKALGVSHLWPDVRLDAREHLAAVVPVVMDPFAEQVLYPEEADSGVMAAAAQVDRAQSPDQLNAGVSELFELVEQPGRRALAVVPFPLDGRLVPTLKRRLIGRQDRANASGEAAPLSLDQVPQDFLNAPLAGG